VGVCVRVHLDAAVLKRVHNYPLCLSVCSQSVVWCEESGVQTLKTRAEGAEGRHPSVRLLTGRRKKDGAEKIMKFWDNFYKKREKKTKRRQNICTFSSQCLTFYLFVRGFFNPSFFFLEATAKVRVRMRIYL